MNKELRETILRENVKLGKIESKIYRQIHSEIYNFYEQKRIADDIDFILKNIQNKKDMTALDIGCGTGNLLLKFLSRGFIVTGVDISSDMLDVLQKLLVDLRFNPENVTLVISDADNFIKNSVSNKRQYDVVSFSSVLHHLPGYLDTVKNACNLVCIGGCLYITHEPLPKPRKMAPFLQRALSFVDEKIYYWRLKIKKVKHPKLSYYKYADYYIVSGKGIDLDRLLLILRENGFRIIRFQKYVTRRNGVFALADNVLKICPSNAFSLIALKSIT